MKNLFFIALIHLIGGVGFSAIGQTNPEIDSLLVCLQNEKADTAKVDLMHELAAAYRIQKSEKAEVFANQALELSTKVNYRNGMGTSYKILGIQAFYRGDYDKALGLFEKSIKLFTETGSKIDLSDCYRKMGISEAFKENYEKAIAHYEKALTIDREIDNKKGLADGLNDIGVMYNYLGDHKKSMELQQQSLAVCRELGDKKAIAARLLNLGAAYEDQSHYQPAIDCYTEALALNIEIDHKRGISNCYNNLGEVYNNRGDYGMAITYYEKSLQIDEVLEDHEGMAISLLNIGNVHAKNHNEAKALEYYQKSLAIAQVNESKRVATEALINIGEMLIRQQNLKEALGKLETAIDLSLELGDKNKEAKAVFFIGEVYLAQNRFAEAIAQYKKAHTLHSELDELNESATDIIKMGKAWYCQGNTQKAIALSLEGLDMAKKVGSKENIRLASEYLSQYYAQQGLYQDAYKYHQLFKQTHDSLFTLESKRQLSEVESRFELVNKQQEIELQNTKLEKQEAEIKQQRAQKQALIGIVSGILVAVILMVNGYIRIRKSKNIIAEQMEVIKEANEELNQKNEELNVTLETISQQQKQIETKNKEITDSIHYAKHIQRAILPSAEKLNKLLPEHFVLNKPKNIISGDFYWVTETNGQTLLAVADCTGHGVPGAFMSMLGISFLNEIIVKESITDVDEVLNRLRNEIIFALNQKGVVGEQNEGMEIGLCAINRKTMQLHFAGANMPVYIIRHKDKPAIGNAVAIAHGNHVLYELKGNKMPISLYIIMNPFLRTDIELCQGDQIYLFSDGFADQFGGHDNSRFRYKPFKELLLANCALPMAAQKNALETAFNAWQFHHEQIDDVLVLGFEL